MAADPISSAFRSQTVPRRLHARRLITQVPSNKQKLGNQNWSRRGVCAAESRDSDAPNNATTNGGGNRATEDLACFGTGSEVECIIPETSQETSNGIAKARATPLETSAQPGMPSTSGILEALLLVSPFFFWGTSMVAMKQLAPHTMPLFVASWRLLPAGIALLAWAAASGRKQPTTPMAWLAISLFALADGACFQGFLAQGLQRTSAGLGSVIIDSQPLSVALLASALFGERLATKGYAGLLLGIFGLLLLEVPPSMLETLPDIAGPATSVQEQLQPISSHWSLWDSGEWWMLLAAQSMAVGTVMVRWVAKYCDPVMATGWHMILGGIPLAALALTQETPELYDRLSQLTLSDAGSLLYVSLLGSAASYGVFFYEATVRGNLTALSSLTFLTPMFAAMGGFVVLGETLTPLQLTGAAVTLAGVTLINSPKDN
jgi:drug/metabolite transporter (DMT)-like permease